jgi:hypothetical protein
MHPIDVALMVSVGLLPAGGCDRHAESTPAAAPSPAAQVLGVAPAPPSGDPLTVRPVAGNASELDKRLEIAAMPLPGQADDPETVAHLNSERAEAIDVLKDPELARFANSDAALERWRQKKLKQVESAPLRHGTPPQGAVKTAR